jgi:hypothetical protein
MSTESVLHDWRYGQTQAERLCAALMHLEGYAPVDPQHPLGGQDAGKDILGARAGKMWVGAAYFPPISKSFSEIEQKFCHDFLGVQKNRASGFAFL